MTASGASALEGRSFGGYRIGQAIASGGMATVFMARKTGPGRYAQTVALKVIHPHLARNRELVEMFQDEARLASCVNHPNVSRVLDFGEAEGTFFLAMEYVRGETWAHVLESFRAHREARLRLTSLAVHVLAHASEGLHAIHEAVGADGQPLRIVHRDVSPHNLLIAYDGSVRLLDFGIASAEGRAHTSGSDVVRGRYPYMAPEQMRGVDVDRRADIWSLGVLLREAISGENPFARETQIGTMLAVTQDPLPPWPGKVPLALREIAERALTREPEARYADARAFGNALTHYLETRAEPALGAELAHFMRQLFAAEITRTRAALRQLAGDDASGDVLSSTFPTRATAARDTDSVLTATAPRRGTSARTRRRLSFLRVRAPSLLAAALLFGLSLAGSWHLVRESAPGTRVAPEGPASGAQTAPTGASGAPVTALLPDQAPAAALSTQPGGATGAQPGAAPTTQAGRAQPGTAAVQPNGAQASARSAEHAAGAVSAANAQSSANAGAPHTQPLPAVEGRPKPAPRARPQASAEQENEEPVAQADGVGTLVIGTTQGWAEISVEGRVLGNTPLRSELPSGTRMLEVRPYGAGSARRLPVEIKRGQVNKVRLDL
jgi:tRNA A-37 threonylcarbamoyl transferase component Bud32